MFLYYFPNKNTEDITDSYLMSLNLNHLAGVNLSLGIVKANGPDKGMGVIKAVTSTAGGLYQEVRKVGCYLNEQTWVQYGDVWIGWFNGQKPTPEGLLKRDAIGFPCDTEIGKFIISPARFMPNRVRLSPKGEVEYIPKEECVPTLSLIEEVLTNFDGDTIKPEHLRLCAMAIGINYRIGLPECYALNMFDNQSVFQIIQAVSDMKAMQEMLRSMEDKKKAVDTQSINSGD
jgi:hypothetical protein